MREGKCRVKATVGPTPQFQASVIYMAYREDNILASRVQIPPQPRSSFPSYTQSCISGFR